MGKIISGFSNIGKTYLMKSGKYNCYDFDTTWFKKVPQWEEVYVECLLALQDKYDYVFTTTHGVVLELLNKKKVEYYLVYPERHLKEAYRKRAIERNSPEDFVIGFFSRWDMHIDDCEKNKYPQKIILKENEYLSDIIDKL